MEEEKIKRIQGKLKVFSFSMIQDLVTLFDILEREGISIENVKDYITFLLGTREANLARFREITEERKKEWKRITNKCPLCGKPLDLIGLRIPKGKGNKFGYKSLWSCPGEECLYEKYSKKEVKKLVATQIRKKGLTKEFEETKRQWKRVDENCNGCSEKSRN